MVNNLRKHFIVQIMSEERFAKAKEGVANF